MNLPVTAPPRRPRARRARRARWRLVLLALVAAVLATTAPAGAASGIQDQIRAADHVLSGSVTSVEREPGSGARTFVYTLTVEVERVYKGEIDSRVIDLTVAPDSRRCTPPRAGSAQSYVFYLTGEAAEPVATSCRDIARASVAEVSAIEEVLGSGRPPVPTEPEPVQFQPVGVGEPATLSRAVAPGVALVILGLFGLVLVRWRTSRR